MTLEEFFALPEGDITYELVDGEAKPKMLPKRFHSSLTGALCFLLTQWNQDRGEVGIEWAIALKRKGKDWVPIPDLLYISADRLSRDRILDEPCPVPPELAIEIISPDQSFGEISGKAIDYLNAGVSRVWVVDAKVKTITIFYPDSPPQTKREDEVITDELLPGLEFTPTQIFNEAKIP
nr:Uma2 family endonuclease [Phormidium pseudopriestleyi]